MSVPHHFHLLPKPVACGVYSVGQLLSKPNSTDVLNPTSLGNRDYDDTHNVEWYKDILSMDNSGRVTSSLGANLLLPRQAPETTLVLLEAENMSVRTLKDPQGVLKRVCGPSEAAIWLKAHKEAGEEVYFVSAVKEVKNASFRRASLIDAGNDMVKVRKLIQMEAAAQGEGLERVNSAGSDIMDIGSSAKSDVIAVEVRKIIAKDGGVELGEIVEKSLWD